MYDVYLDKILLPIAPSKIQLKVKNQNKTVTLINEGEINLLKKAGLTDISFSVLIPQVNYPFAKYSGGFKGAEVFFDAFEKLKTNLDTNGNFKPFQFIVSRVTPGGALLFDSNIKVSLEDYTISEEAKNGLDIIVDVRLKQYREYGTKAVKIEEPPAVAASQPEPPKAVIQPERPVENAPKTNTFTVSTGDTLWAIAKKYYNNGNDYTKILAANKDKISNPSRIYAGQVLVIP